GIAPEKLDQIFEAFQQSDGTTNRKYGGTGLGLSISRDMAGLLGGRIIAESEQGVGSAFTLFVPVHYTGPPSGALPAVEARPVSSTTRAIAELTALTGRPAAEPGPASQVNVFRSQESVPRTGPRPDGSDDGVSWPETTRLRDWLSGRLAVVLADRRILIVDDDIRNVFALTHVLGRVGISVKYAENGREGLEVLDQTPDVSLVLMDIMMPEMDGYEMIAAIRRTPRFADLPIIALTAKAMPGDREKAIESGADDYVPKPVDVDRLLSVICRLLDPQCTLPEPRPDPSDNVLRATDRDDGDTLRNRDDDDGATGRPS
ncbi:ATP-binding response regulator, partial [Streptomyces sp. NPDC005166]